MHRTPLCIAPVVLSAAASANTWIDAAAGGGDLTNLPQAVAASAQGDVLLVMPGNSSGFALDQRLVIVGQGPGVNVDGLVHVHDVSTGSAAVRVELGSDGAKFENGSRPVILDTLTSSATIEGSN
ncbi:MAG: hypothetical protein L6Q99_09420 [Planctomycetes bacterium]|nr:hypothetical protein [Planctomycetota bacterium]